MPHPYRHVYGWYRLVKELQDSGVSAICVFDGTERSQAKAREIERRRGARRLAVARGSIELDRVKRLNNLIDVVDRYEKLDVIEKGRVSELFQQISSELELPPLEKEGSPLPLEEDEQILQGIPTYDDLETKMPSSPIFREADAIQDVVLEPPDNLWPLQQDVLDDFAPIAEPDTLDTLADASSEHPDGFSTPVPKQVSDTLQDGAAQSQTRHPNAVVPSEEDLASLRSASIPPAQSPNKPVAPLDRSFPSPEICDTADSKMFWSASDKTLDTLGNLYHGFRDSVRKLASLTPPGILGASTLPDIEQQDVRVEYSLSKSQVQLMAEEQKFWEELSSPRSISSDSQPFKATLKTLVSRADLMCQSYERRTNPPTTQTYDESKELLRSMGVPCVDTSGMYEAEALASAMVINGHADYVASEDTDVVLYEAPLIRNITNRSGPLLLLSGAEIRAALELDRASFIDFALLLGTDFSQRIKNVGPARALKFIREYKSIERVVEAEKKYTPRVPTDAYLAEVERARLVFLTLPPVPDERFLVQDKDSEGLTVLLQRFGLGKLLMDESWNFEEALKGNYFFDDPSAH